MSIIKFYLLLLKEVFQYFLCKKKPTHLYSKKIRKSITADSSVIFGIHEWAGYAYSRYKVIKYRNLEFKCGLIYSLERLNNYNGIHKISKILTISGASENYLSKLIGMPFFSSDIKWALVDNRAMDFSGYSYIFHNYLNNDINQYVFLTNTSVSDNYVNGFIDEYIKVFNENKNLGILGISYSSKIYQSLLKNNFNPHIQSFFMLTTSGILRDVVKKNGNIFPGENEDYKLSIIRFGEAKISELILQLGFDIGIIDENGELVILPCDSMCKKEIVDGDYRLYAKNPNSINKVNSKYL